MEFWFTPVKESHQIGSGPRIRRLWERLPRTLLGGFGKPWVAQRADWGNMAQGTYCGRGIVGVMAPRGGFPAQGLPLYCGLPTGAGIWKSGRVNFGLTLGFKRAVGREVIIGGHWQRYILGFNRERGNKGGCKNPVLFGPGEFETFLSGIAGRQARKGLWGGGGPPLI